MVRRNRDAVLGNIAEVFRRHGYEGASLGRMTAATGLGKGSLYNFFPDGKEQMAREVLAHVHRWFEEEIFRPLEEIVSPDHGLQCMFESVETYFQSGRRICLMGLFALETEDTFSSQIHTYFARWEEALGLFLQRSGWGEREARDLAEGTVSGIQGALVLAQARREPDVFARRMHALRLRLQVSQQASDARQSGTRDCLQGP